MLALVLVLALVYVGGALIAARLFGERGRELARKHQAVECSSTPMGDARIQFKVGYYLFALVFMVFDVEALFLFPAVKALAEGDTDTGILMLEIATFVAVLFLALIYAWRRKVLEWQ
ncbi:MAG: NADH-quinone oxidoreductase subunit A [Planctomycetota bacterium]|nr:NADH-quinone oxidoreductase subunit A [Planctomycetota bacterium]